MPYTRGPRAVSQKRPVPETFEIWFKQKRRIASAGIKAAFALPGLALALSLLNISVRGILPQLGMKIDEVVTVVLFLQFLIVGFMYFLIPQVPTIQRVAVDSPTRSAAEKLEEKAQEFSGLWSYAWLCWAILYFALGMNSLAKQFFPTVDLWFVAPAANLLNNIQTVFFVMCFRSLRYPAHEKRSPLAAAIAAAVIVAVCETFFLIPGMSLHNSLGNGLSQVLGWASGVLGGVAIALLVGRLETKLVDAPVKMTTTFYFYASIQAAFPFLRTDAHLALVFTSLAFLFKLCLFYFMAWLIDSGVLMFYFDKMLELDDKTPKERRSFLEHIIAKAG